MPETSLSNKFSQEVQCYKYRDGYLVAIARNKIRGRGRALQLRYTSEAGKDFNLLGWGLVITKNTKA
jgi:hypothetical protein